MKSIQILILILFVGINVFSQNQEEDIVLTKYYIGASYSLMNSYNIGNLLDFWQNINNDPNEEIGQATGFFNFRLGLQSSSSKQKHWIGSELQIIITPSHALWGTNLFYGGKNEVYYKAFFSNICLYFGFAVDPKSKMVLIIEPGLDIGTMTGAFSTTTSYYKQGLTVGLGGHGALGIDYHFLENLSANFRIGYRYIKINEMHEDKNSDTGYSTFYVEGSSGETVKVDWSGTYMTIGFTLSFNSQK